MSAPQTLLSLPPQPWNDKCAQSSWLILTQVQGDRPQVLCRTNPSVDERHLPSPHFRRWQLPPSLTSADDNYLPTAPHLTHFELAENSVRASQSIYSETWHLELWLYSLCPMARVSTTGTLTRQKKAKLLFQSHRITKCLKLALKSGFLQVSKIHFYPSK